jgi:PAS domain-containing protein
MVWEPRDYPDGIPSVVPESSSRSFELSDARHHPNFRSSAALFQQAQAASRRLFERSPLALLTLTPDLRIVDANGAYLRAVGRRRDTIADMPVFDAFPDSPHDPKPTGVRDLSASLQRVLLSGDPDVMRVIRYDIQSDVGPWEVRYWTPKNWPILDDEGVTVALVHHAIDVTESMFTSFPELRPRTAPEAAPAADDAAADVDKDKPLFRARMEALFNSERVALSRHVISQSLDLLNRSQVPELLSNRSQATRRIEQALMVSRMQEKSSFDTEEIAMLSECYEAILQKLGLTSRADPVTDIVVERLIAVVQSGERDQVRLRELVLASFDR